MVEQWYYYEYAKRASRNVDHHSGLMQLRSIARKADKVLDLGCGEGTRLNTILPSWKKGTGIDISSYAVKKAKKQYPRHRFLHYSGSILPFPNESFDLVYTAFVLEHTTNHQNFLKEALRVTKSKGNLVVLCPNFGAPNRRSPNSVASPIVKLLTGFIRDFLNPDLNTWTKVIPKKKFKQIDDDTTVEPYLLSLKNYFQKAKLKVITASSLWELEVKSYNPRKLLFKILGRLGIFPFLYWGPQVLVVIKKN